MTTKNDTLAIWTVYLDPLDYPGMYVAREFLIRGGQPEMTNNMFVANTLAEIRALLPPWLHCLHRKPADDPKIVESWI